MLQKIINFVRQRQVSESCETVDTQTQSIRDVESAAEMSIFSHFSSSESVE